MTFAQAVKKSGLTTEQVKVFQSAAKRTWEYVGYDVLASVAEMEDDTSIPRADVIEIVLDANYMDQFLDSTLKSWKNQSWETRSKDHYEVQKALLKPAFGFSRYGM